MVCQNIFFLAFLDYQVSVAKIEIHYFSIEKSSSSGDLLLEHLIEEFKLVVAEKNEFDNLDKISDIFDLFGLSRNESKQKPYALSAQG